MTQEIIIPYVYTYLTQYTAGQGTLLQNLVKVTSQSPVSKLAEIYNCLFDTSPAGATVNSLNQPPDCLSWKIANQESSNLFVGDNLPAMMTQATSYTNIDNQNVSCLKWNYFYLYLNGNLILQLDGTQNDDFKYMTNQFKECHSVRGI